MNKQDEIKKDNDDIEVLEVWEPHADKITSAKDRHIKMSQKSVNRIVIALVTIGAFLVMWYSIFAQPLAFNNRQMKTGAWNISFVDMKLESKIGGARELSHPDYTSTKASFYVSLTGKGDKIVYELTIKNSGTIDAMVDGIYIIPENKPSDQIIYSVGGINLGDELKAGQSTKMTVTAMYNNGTSTIGTVRKDMSVIINYKQK
ncbi:MAG: hypothetical protein PUA73_02795 [Bacilli bacterium]|nr:hypothetical protein [Bacilli bacterium]